MFAMKGMKRRSRAAVKFAEEIADAIVIKALREVLHITY